MFKMEDRSVDTPPFAATKGLVVDTHLVTKCAFMPILPYPEAEFDSIFAAMFK